MEWGDNKARYHAIRRVHVARDPEMKFCRETSEISRVIQTAGQGENIMKVGCQGGGVSSQKDTVHPACKVHGYKVNFWATF